MAARPCPISLCECPGVDAPITNISAEAPDPLLFWGQIWNPYNPWRPPPLGNGLDVKVDCDIFNEIFSIYDPVVYASTQLMANLQALAASLGCPWPPSGEETFINDAQTASVSCPDGTLFSYTVDAGTMTSPPMDAELGAAWVLWANAWASAYAYQQASALLSCFEEDETPDDLPPGGGGPGDDPPIPPTPPPGGGGMLPDVLWTCLGEGVYRVYIMSGSASSSYTISLVEGSLPPGTALVPIDGRRIALTGVPTTAGGYAFKLRAVSTTSPTVMGEVWIAVYIFGLTTSTLPDGEVGTAYSFALTAAGGTAPYTYALDPGSTLPDTFILDADGTLHSPGPTTDGDFTFDVVVTDANDGECVQTVSLFIDAGLSPILWWPMELGAATGPKSDVIESVALSYLQGNAALWTNELGIVGNSWQLRALDIGGQHPARVQTAVTPFVDFTDEGISVAWWTYWNSPASSAASGIRYNFRIGITDHVIQVYQWPANLIVLLDFVTVITEASLSQNAWHFLSLVCDNVAGILHLHVDSVNDYTATIGSFPLGPYSNSSFQLNADVSGVGGLNMRFDEVAFFDHPLTAAELDALWNGGAGRTWP